LNWDKTFLKFDSYFLSNNIQFKFE
jgi:hypothetical protein